MSEDEEIYEVESILGHRVVNGQEQYLVHWKGYDSKDDTWEPLENVASCADIVKEYTRKERERKERELSSMDNPKKKESPIQNLSFAVNRKTSLFPSVESHPQSFQINTFSKKSNNNIVQSISDDLPTITGPKLILKVDKKDKIAFIRDEYKPIQIEKSIREHSPFQTLQDYEDKHILYKTCVYQIIDMRIENGVKQYCAIYRDSEEPQWISENDASFICRQEVNDFLIKRAFGQIGEGHSLPADSSFF